MTPIQIICKNLLTSSQVTMDGFTNIENNWMRVSDISGYTLPKLTKVSIIYKSKCADSAIQEWALHIPILCVQVAGSLSDGLTTASMDENHKETRDLIRQQPSSTGDHLIAGVKGLGYGIFGGITSVFTQPISGAKAEGVEVTTAGEDNMF